MYIQFKHGFIEADAWDGNRELPIAHRRSIGRASEGRAVIIVRSRERATIEHVLASAHVTAATIFHTPEWDYAFRAYLSVDEWSAALAAIASDLDYRNFKSWCAVHSSRRRAMMAHEIWAAGRISGSQAG